MGSWFPSVHFVCSSNKEQQPRSAALCCSHQWRFAHPSAALAAIEALQAVPGSDIIQVQRLKKRKLVLRDRITFIEDQLTPVDLKAVSVYVFSHAAPGEVTRRGASSRRTTAAKGAVRVGGLTDSRQRITRPRDR